MMGHKGDRANQIKGPHQLPWYRENGGQSFSDELHRDG